MSPVMDSAATMLAELSVAVLAPTPDPSDLYVKAIESRMAKGFPLVTFEQMIKARRHFARRRTAEVASGRNRAAAKAKRTTESACAVCGWKAPAIAKSMLHIHHIIPVKCHGTNDPANLVGLCPTHHEVTHTVFYVVGSVFLCPQTRASLIVALRAIEEDSTQWEALWKPVRNAWEKKLKAEEQEQALEEYTAIAQSIGGSDAT